MSANQNPSIPSNILVVDDTPANLKVLAGMLQARGYDVRPVPNGELALQAARNDPPDLILLDINMPEMDGYEVCERLKADPKLIEIPVIFISALTETLNKSKAFSAGGVDYITKPFQFDEVVARVETHLRLHHFNLHLRELVQEKVQEVADSQMATIFAMAKLSESRDDDTGKHLEHVQIFCKLLASQLSKQPRYEASINTAYIDNIFRASPLHDIGKVGIPDKILLKPGRLTPAEFETMKTHTLIGARTLEAVWSQYPKNIFINMGIAIARWHHENWDGSGYPDGLAGEHIPLAARIMAVADVYDALRSRRVYKPVFSHAQSCESIFQDSGTHFDPDLVAAFRELNVEFKETRDRMG